MTSMDGVVFTRDNIEQRFNYAVLVNRIPDEQLGFLDESGFNLHKPLSEPGHQKDDRPPNKSWQTERRT